MKIKKIWQTISLPVYIIGIVGFFIQFAATLIYSTAFVLVADVFIPNHILRTVRSITEPTSTLIKIFSGYMSDLSDNKKNFLLYGYGSVCLMKTLFWISILDIKLFNHVSRSLFYIITFSTDRLINAGRDAPRDGLIIESIPDKKMLPMAFAIRKGIASMGSVVGGVVGFFLIKYKILNAQQIYFFALFPAIIGSALIFFIKNPESTKKTEQKKLGPLFLFLWDKIVPYLLIGFCFKDLGYLTFIPIFIGIFQKQNSLFSLYAVSVSSISYFLPIDLNTKCILLSIIMFDWDLKPQKTTLVIYLLAIVQSILIYKNYNIFDQSSGNNKILILSVGIVCVSIIARKFIDVYEKSHEITFKNSLWSKNTPVYFEKLKIGLCAISFNLVLGLISGVFSPFLHIPLFQIFYLIFESFFQSEPYRELKTNFKEYKSVLLKILFGVILVGGKLNDTVFFERGIQVGFDKIYTILFFVLLYISISAFSFIWGKFQKSKLILFLLCINLMCSNFLLCFPGKISFILSLITLGAYSGGIDSSLVAIVSSNLKSSKAKGTILGLFFTTIGFSSMLAGIGMSRLINNYDIIFAAKCSMISPILAFVSLFFI